MMHGMAPSGDGSDAGAADIFTEMLRIQGEAARQAIGAFLPEASAALPDDAALAEWGASARKIQQMWTEYHQSADALGWVAPLLADPAQWMTLMQGVYQQMPLLDPVRQQAIWEEGIGLWEDILGQFGMGPKAGESPAEGAGGPVLPRADRRFADPAWRERPVFALIHQTYLLLAERVNDAIEDMAGLDEAERERLRFAARGVMDAMSPSNFALMNPLVLVC